MTIQKINEMNIGIVFQESTAEAKIAQATKNGIVQAMKHLNLKFHEIPFTQNFVRDIQSLKIDAIFNAMHGKYGEDGYIQTILNALEIPYTHSGTMASQIGMNKVLTNSYAKSCGIPILQSEVILKDDLLNGKYLISKKSIIKPVTGGSSVATFILEEGEVLSKSQLEEVENFIDSPFFMIEEFTVGKEIAVGILNNEVVGTCKIIPSEEFYTYNAKYNSKETTYQTPAQITESMRQKIHKDALKIHKAIGAHCVSRVDFICDEHNYKFLEINTHPGMTATSLLPKICAYNGISYENVVEILLKAAKFERV